MPRASSAPTMRGRRPTYSLRSSPLRERERKTKLALGSEIDGENTTVAQLIAQLDNAKWELDQTTIRAPADGYISTMALAVGARVGPLRAALSFILTKDVTLIGVFSQNGFQTSTGHQSVTSCRASGRARSPCPAFS